MTEVLGIVQPDTPLTAAGKPPHSTAHVWQVRLILWGFAPVKASLAAIVLEIVIYSHVHPVASNSGKWRYLFFRIQPPSVVSFQETPNFFLSLTHNL